MLPKTKKWWVGVREKRRMEQEEKRTKSLLLTRAPLVWFVASRSHPLLWLYKDKHNTERRTAQHRTQNMYSIWNSDRIAADGSVCQQKNAYRGVGCNIWRTPRPWVCRGKGTGGGWDRWCGQPESEWRSLWLCRAWGSKPFSHLQTHGISSTRLASVSSEYNQLLPAWFLLSKPLQAY